MFLLMFVCRHKVCAGSVCQTPPPGRHPLGRHPQAGTPAQHTHTLHYTPTTPHTPSLETATEAGGTHLTGIDLCCVKAMTDPGFHGVPNPKV